MKMVDKDEELRMQQMRNDREGKEKIKEKIGI